MPKRGSRRGLILGIVSGIRGLVRQRAPATEKPPRPTCLAPSCPVARVVRSETCGPITTLTYEWDASPAGTQDRPCWEGQITTVSYDPNRPP